jgi:hypothetical protein
MGQVPEEQERAFFAEERSDAVPFVINDSVDVVCGSHAGSCGAVIAITQVLPKLRLLVELADGTDVVLDADTLQRLSP